MLASCPDCEGNDGAVSVSEVITQVAIALGVRPLDDCRPADEDGNDVLTVDELIRAVAASLGGCPTPTPTLGPTFTATPLATPSATATGSPSATSSASPTSVASASATPTASDTTTPTFRATDTPSPTPTAEPGATDTPSATATTVPSDTETPTATPTPTVTRTATNTVTPTPTSSSTVTPTVSRTSTPVRTPTITRTPAATRTRVPGSRRFSLDQGTSGIRTFVVPDDLASSSTGFRGFLDLSMGTPDENGVAPLNLVGASEFLFLPLDGATFCFRPFLPRFRAGVIACDGGFDLGVRTTQDHRIGVVGVGGFTAGNCTAAGGTVETPPAPHPGVCNGPVNVFLSGESDSGAGAVLIAPDARFDTRGIEGVITVEPGPCDTHQGGQQAILGFVSGLYRVEILDADDSAGATLRHDEHGEAFSCAQFTQENGPGRLVLGVGALHGASGLDVVTVFDLDD